MISIKTPGYKDLALEHLVLDFNGTLATDGKLIKGIQQVLNDLSQTINLHILTGDIHGTARNELKNINGHLHIIPTENQIQAKTEYIQSLPSADVVVIGNGRNDAGMLEVADLSILVIGEEGASFETIKSCDVVVVGIFNALNLLLFPQRLMATLRC